MRKVKKNKSPSKVHKDHCSSKARKKLLNAMSLERCKERPEAPSRFQRKRIGGRRDAHYGDPTPDVSEDVLQQRCADILARKFAAADTAEKRAIIERDTRGQQDNPLWEEWHRDTLSSVNFKKAAIRGVDIPCDKLLRTILRRKKWKKLPSAIEFGITHEKDAVAFYERKFTVSTKECGLFVDAETPFLVASPDRLVGSNGLLEVKCLYANSQKYKNIDGSKIDSLRETKKGSGEFILFRGHDYYYQIQGQLNITGRAWCDLVLYNRHTEVKEGKSIVTEDIKVEKIYRDSKFWKEKKPKLIKFYKDYMLPELADSRIDREMECRNPAYAIEPIAKRRAKLLANLLAKKKAQQSGRRPETVEIDVNVDENENDDENDDV
ncbi:hypothetical protein FOCC_FOCC017175 [Frankliniella occidentalis]|nr:hypothetical protein FOCC_FOCC017175 [Frankliniella occidentalis]